jgi:hypothetical protein
MRFLCLIAANHLDGRDAHPTRSDLYDRFTPKNSGNSGHAAAVKTFENCRKDAQMHALVATRMFTTLSVVAPTTDGRRVNPGRLRRRLRRVNFVVKNVSRRVYHVSRALTP